MNPRRHTSARTSTIRLARASAAIAALLTLAGCNTTDTGLVLQPGDVASLRIDGRQPRVRIHNQGPGDVRVEYSSPADRADLGPGGTITRSLIHPHLTIANNSNHRAIVDVQARHADGLIVESPTTPPTPPAN